MVTQFTHTRAEDTLHADATPPHSLPSELTSFIGRTQAIHEVKQLLAQTRLLTLTGAGGIGKTRLALRVASDMLDAFSDGVWWVELAALSDPALLPQAIASVLSVREQPERPLRETLAHTLRHKEVLLVLDNCEHVIAACAALTDALLRACPWLRILATSREALMIQGETVWSVPPLQLPTPTTQFSLEQLAQCETIQLLAARIKEVVPSFTLHAHNAQAAAQICQRLDGLPLAIELAAARAKLLAVEQIAARLDDIFYLLTNGQRAAVPRHQTLRAALDWSYELLSEPERVLLRRLSVFVGSFTLEAVEASCTYESVTQTNVLDLLARLIDKSLILVVEREKFGQARYRLLEPIRQYGWEQLRAAGEETAWRTRQLDYCVTAIEVAAPHLRGADKEVWVGRFSSDDSNFNAALAWALDSNNIEAGLRLVAVLWWYWELRGDFQHSRHWLERMVQRANQTPASNRGPGWQRAYAQALLGLGTITWTQGDLEAARSSFEQCIVKAEQVGDRWTYAYALDRLGRVCARQGDLTRARTLYEQSLVIFRALDDTWGISRPLRDLGRLAMSARDYPTATTYLQEALALRRAAGDREGIADAHSSLGDIYWMQGLYEQAERHFTECLALYRAIGYNDGVAEALQNLGFIALLQRQPEQALTFLREGLRLRYELGEKVGIVLILTSLCSVALTYKDARRAAQLIGAIEVVGLPLDEVLPPQDHFRSSYDRHLAAARAALTPTTFARYYAEGQALTLEQVVAYALSEPQTPQAADASPAPPTSQSKPQHFDGLTARQHEVAALIAQGQTNREIAETLVLSEYTVMAHVAHILNKLGFNSRTQIASWALERGLVKTALK